MKSTKYDHKRIEAKWRESWLKTNLYTPDLKNAKKPFYNLMMFPYPSAEGLHVGNMYAFAGTDIFGRFQRMRGYDVFEPIGLDGFGIHSENYAIKVGRHPREHAKISEENFYKQLSMIGNGFAWDHRVETYDPEYYKWTQWLFIQMFKAGLAYRGTAMVNWCPSCKTVLSDEQVLSGECERCGSEVERREMSSWYFKITKYADRLLENIDGSKAVGSEQLAVSKLELVRGIYDVKKNGLRWPEKIKIAQRNWIGKKSGINIDYELKSDNRNLKDKVITCFTTRPDTNFGATFIVVAPEYARDNLLDLLDDKNAENVSKYIKSSLNKSEQQRIADGNQKSGVFTGLFAVNKLNGYETPVWVGDFVLAGVGTGAVIGVPGHDKRDFEFAKKFDLPIKRVVKLGDDTSEIISLDQVQENDGVMINSEFLDGLNIHEATIKMMDFLEEKGWGKRVYHYHLRDWLISRQRYWGPPIPMVYCDKCDWQPIDISELPLLLPDIQDFKPKGDGTSPLSNAPDSWKHTKCPKCGGKARRELDVCDTFLDSSWYFLAYPNLKTEEWKQDIQQQVHSSHRVKSVKDDKESMNSLLSLSNSSSPLNREITKKWLPVDAYIGGAEHAVLHLLYARFVTMVLNDLKMIDFEEPFPFLYGHGLIIKDGAKMSKSKGNVVNPDEYIEKFGADTLRCYLMFLGSYDAGGDFRDTGIEGMHRFLMRVWSLFENTNLSYEDDKELLAVMHKTIKKVTEDMQIFKYNTALSAIMEYVNALKAQFTNYNLQFTEKKTKSEKSNAKDSEMWSNALIVLAKLLAPFAPHMTEEFWKNVIDQKESIHISSWPEYDEKYIQTDDVTVVVQVNGKLRGQISTTKSIGNDKEAIIKLAMEDKIISKWLKEGKVKKEIFVPCKLINFVVK